MWFYKILWYEEAREVQPRNVTILASLTEETRSKMVITPSWRRAQLPPVEYGMSFFLNLDAGSGRGGGTTSRNIAHCQEWLLMGGCLGSALTLTGCSWPCRSSSSLVTICTPAFLLCVTFPLWALWIREHRHASLIIAVVQGTKMSLHWQGRVCARWYRSTSSSVSLPYLPYRWVRMCYLLFSRSRVALGTIHALWFCSGAFLDQDCPFFPFSHVTNFIHNSSQLNGFCSF